MTSEGIEQSGRLGYQIIIDFVTLLQCRLEVHSKRGQGTTVRISGIPTINREIQKKNATDHENTPVF
jgi:nitrate/nitrite-specific signal transduction histidine kinase